MSAFIRGSKNQSNQISPLSHAEYNQLAKLVYNFSRIDLGPNRYEMVKARLQKRLNELNLFSYQDYISLLESDQGKEEIKNLIDLISTNYTFFFREEAHFDFLKHTIIPLWCEPRPKSIPFRVWCAAASSGEEPYSISITIQDYIQAHKNFDWHLDCSDISTRMLKQAHEGIFEAAKLEKLPPKMVSNYFKQGYGDWKGYYRVTEDLRKKITFQQINLLQTSYPFPYKFNAIFCRNVMIYFDKETQKELIKKLLLHLEPGGHLIVGHAESLAGISHSLKLIQPAIYEFKL